MVGKMVNTATNEAAKKPAQIWTIVIKLGAYCENMLAQKNRMVKLFLAVPV